MTRNTGHTVLPLAFLCLCCLVLIGALSAPVVQAADFPNARWKAEEQRCIEACPPFPRFAGAESDAQFQRRIAAENAYNQCYGKCVKQYQERVRLGYKPFNDGSQGYHRRNGGQ